MREIKEKVQKKRKRNESVKLGRPKVKDRNKMQFVEKDDYLKESVNEQNSIKQSSETIKEEFHCEINKLDCLISIFMQFFQSINFRRGFIFTQLDRQKLIKQSNLFTSSKEPQWNEQREKQKFQKIFSDNQVQGIQLLREISLHTSSIFDEEATPQLYTIILNIWKICLIKNQNQKKTKLELYPNHIKEQTNNYPFFTFIFSKIYKINLNRLHQGIITLVYRISEEFNKIIDNLRNQEKQQKREQIEEEQERQEEQQIQERSDSLFSQ